MWYSNASLRLEINCKGCFVHLLQTIINYNVPSLTAQESVYHQTSCFPREMPRDQWPLQSNLFCHGLEIQWSICDCSPVVVTYVRLMVKWRPGQVAIGVTVSFTRGVTTSILVSACIWPFSLTWGVQFKVHEMISRASIEQQTAI